MLLGELIGTASYNKRGLVKAGSISDIKGIVAKFNIGSTAFLVFGSSSCLVYASFFAYNKIVCQNISSGNSPDIYYDQQNHNVYIVPKRNMELMLFTVRELNIVDGSSDNYTEFTKIL